MTKLTPRFLIAGFVLVVAGAAIVVTREGVGQDAPWVGGLVAAIGVGLVASGLLRIWKRPD
jgi:hypothetical protein